MTGFRGIILSLFLSINLFQQIHHISAQNYLSYSCINTATSTPGFKANLINTIVPGATAFMSAYGFYQNSAGTGADQVYGIAYCRGDVDVQGLCKTCVKQAANSLTTTRCPNSVEAIIWYDECLFRYSNKAIFGAMTLNPFFALQSSTAASNVTLFRQQVSSLAASLVGPTSKGSFLTSRKFSAMKSSSAEIYGVMQCDPSISTSDCASCLNSVSNALSNCCYSRVGARWITPSCTFHYETYPFINNPSNN